MHLLHQDLPCPLRKGIQYTKTMMELPSERGYKITLECLLGPAGQGELNERATLLLSWCDYRWKVKNRHLVAYGNALVVAERENKGTQEDLEEYVKMYAG